jgi:hypothetical protein
MRIFPPSEIDSSTLVPRGLAVESTALEGGEAVIVVRAASGAGGFTAPQYFAADASSPNVLIAAFSRHGRGERLGSIISCTISGLF